MSWKNSSGRSFEASSLFFALARWSRNWGSHESGKVNKICKMQSGPGAGMQLSGENTARNNQILGVWHHPHCVSLSQPIFFWNLGRDCSFGHPKSPLIHRTTNFIQCKEHSARADALKVCELLISCVHALVSNLCPCSFARIFCWGSLCMCARAINWSRAQSCKRMHITKSSFSNGDCDQLLATSEWAQEASTEHNNYSALK